MHKHIKNYYLILILYLQPNVIVKRGSHTYEKL